MNRKQKIILVSFGFIALSAILVWISFGGEIFTKTQVLVEKKDELFGWSQKQWADKFIWGLDLSGVIIFISAAISGLLLYLYRSKKGGKELSQ